MVYHVSACMRHAIRKSCALNGCKDILSASSITLVGSVNSTFALSKRAAIGK